MHGNQDHSEQIIFINGPAGKLESKVSGFSNLTSEEHTNIGIMCHPHPLYQGTMDNKVVTTVIRAWQELGFASIRFNFRGVGQSEGEYGHGIGEKDDLKAILAWSLEKTQKKQNIKIWLAGFSFGAAISAQLASEWPDMTLPHLELAALLSLAPGLQFLHFRADKIPLCPWLIVHGEKDEVVNVEEVKSWFQDLKEKRSKIGSNKRFDLVIFPETTHFFHGKLIALKELIINFTGSIIS